MSYAPVRQTPPLAAAWRAQAPAVDAAFLADAGPTAMARLGGHAPFAAVWARFERPGLLVVASVALGAGLCESGPNSAASNQLHAVCPMKVSVTRGATTRTLLVTRACYLEVVHAAVPGGPTPADNGDFAYLDPAGTTLTVETIRDGSPVPACTKSVDLRAL